MNIIILLAIAVFLLWFFVYRNVRTRSGIDQFTKKLPKERYPDLVAEFGKPDDHANGIIYWYNKKELYNRIVLKDEEILHCKPAKHYDFLYSTISVYIPRDVVCEIMKISKSIYYDQLKRELTVRCHFTGANIATLYLALQVASGELTVSSIEALASYKKTIMATMNDPAYRDRLEDEIRQMQTTLNVNAPPPESC